MDLQSAIARQRQSQVKIKSSLGSVSVKSERLEKPDTRSKRRKDRRDVAELAILESIQRIKSARRSSPKDWERGYNSAITQLELFLAEIKAKGWARTEL